MKNKSIIEELGIKSEYKTSMVNGNIVLKLENQRNELLETLIDIIMVDNDIKFLEAMKKAALVIEKASDRKIDEITGIYNALA